MTTNPMSSPGPSFPFAALRGQPELRLALLLAAIEPALGGVLVEGPRGTAKSTAARALAELLPDAPFVTLPLGASLEHLVGSLDLGEALAGHAVRFAPGLLARADGGILYVDEVNLLPDVLVDALLDAAASGIHTVERDGISHSHRARFTLIGTMNPDEGELRPQLLDRFGLSARLRPLDDPQERRLIVRERLAFDADPVAFRARHATEQARLVEALAHARHRVSDLSLDQDDVQARVADLCIRAGVEGLRADLALFRAARALAAWEDAPRVTVAEVERVRELVLKHRVEALHPEAGGREAQPQGAQRQDGLRQDGLRQHGLRQDEPRQDEPRRQGQRRHEQRRHAQQQDGQRQPARHADASRDDSPGGDRDNGAGDLDGSEGEGNGGTGGDEDWGALPAKAVGITHFPSVRSLPPIRGVTAKKS